MTKGIVAVAMSGGVDSAAAAALLKESGYQVFGVTMQLWCEEKHGIRPEHPTCCSINDINDARSVCNILDIPFYVLNFESLFNSLVVEPFCREYNRGLTPNPCVFCNRNVKFDQLMKKVLSLGADYLATGHYARIAGNDGCFELLKASEAKYDQSYFLYMLGQAQLSHLLFPVGMLNKAQVRQIAGEKNLPVSRKPKSQDICFIPDGNLGDFLLSRNGKKSWLVQDGEGNKLGTLEGSMNYTVGQRCGLGIALGKRVYIIRIDPVSGTIVLGTESELYQTRLRVKDFNFVSAPDISQPVEISAKIRFKSPEARAVLKSDCRGLTVEFLEAQRAITPGQSIAFYQGEKVLGGGIIS